MIDYNEIYDRLNKEFACNCEQTHIVWHKASNGVMHYRKQCLRCGNAKSVKKHELTQIELATAKPQSGDIGRKFYEQREARRKELIDHIKNREDEKWWEWYNSYLLSDTWAKKRAARLLIDKAVCQACGVQEASQVHHLTYKHVGDEPLFDLVSICRTCHEKITLLDRMGGTLHAR